MKGHLAEQRLVASKMQTSHHNILFYQHFLDTKLKHNSLFCIKIGLLVPLLPPFLLSLKNNRSRSSEQKTFPQFNISFLLMDLDQFSPGYKLNKLNKLNSRHKPVKRIDFGTILWRGNGNTRKIM